MTLAETQDGYRRASLKLLPPRAYSREGFIAGEAAVNGQVMGGLDVEARALVDTALPPIVNGKLRCPERDLPDWEREYSLPSTGSYELRNARLLVAIRLRRSIRPLDIREALEILLGYQPEITEQLLFRADSPYSLTDTDLIVEPEEEVYRYYVDVDGALARDADYTRADIQRIVEDVQGGHTLGMVRFTGFYADDPYSLTDLDLLDV